MPNIEIQCCGMVILMLVGFFYLRLPKLRVRTKQIFARLLTVATLCTAMDILSVFAIYYAEDLPQLLVSVACKLYLVLLMMMIFSSFIYMCADIFAGKKIFSKITKTTGIIFSVIMVGIQFLPIEYVCENHGRTIYSYGPYTLATYIVFGVIFVSMMVLIWKNRETMQRRRLSAVRMWLAIWLAAALLQLLFSNLLIVTFAGCAGVLIVFLMIENPELALDKSSGFFHASVIPQFVNEFFSNRGYYLINTRFNFSDTAFFEKISNAAVFVGSGEIYLFFATKRSYEDALAKISEHMDKRGVYICEDSTVAENGIELMLLVKKTRELMRTLSKKPTRHDMPNVYVIDHDIKARLKERADARTLINDAIAEDRIEPFYQPIYSIESGKFHSAEALARIRGKDGEIIPPYRFIPFAEENGSIIHIGKKMFEKVCEFFSDDAPEKLGLDYVEVNLSVVQGEDKQLAQRITRTLECFRVTPDRINLEITESASVSGREQLLETMNELIDKGVSFSLDDFGTGHSNLDYMTMMPVTLVKFDRSMTQSYFTSEKTRYVMTAAVNMIHNLGMKIVIEGIETAEQLEEVKKLGVEYIQGYYFSKPLCKADFIEFLKNNNG